MGDATEKGPVEGAHGLAEKQLLFRRRPERGGSPLGPVMKPSTAGDGDQVNRG
jgi:hypothetical protein